MTDQELPGSFNDPEGALPSGENYAHSVIIQFFDYGFDELDPLHELEDMLRKTVSGAGVGIHDGHEIAMDGSNGRLYLYGPNAEVLFKTIKPVLERVAFMRGAMASLRFGPGADASEIEVEI